MRVNWNELQQYLTILGWALRDLDAPNFAIWFKDCRYYTEWHYNKQDYYTIPKILITDLS